MDIMDIPITRGEWKVAGWGSRIEVKRQNIPSKTKTIADFRDIDAGRVEVVANTVVCSEAPEMLRALSEVQEALDDGREISEASKDRIDGILRRVREFKRFV